MIEKRLSGLIILAVVLAVFPVFASNAYVFDVAIRIIINSIVVIGLNLLWGYTGQISLGHAGFIGIGAYASAILTSRFGWPSTLALAAGTCGTGLLAFLIARPILALKGHILAMGTLGFGMIIAIVINNEVKYTGGTDGMSVPSFSVFKWTIAGEYAWYVVFAVLLFAVTWATLNIVDAPAGRALRAICGSEIAAQVVGVNVTSFKVRVFAISAALASLMGSLMAHYVGFLTPGAASFGRSMELMAMVVVGGMASVFGSIVGAAILTLLPQFLYAFKDWETVVFGVILIATMIFLPKGLIPTLRRFRGPK